LLANVRGVQAFLPVSQLSAEHYPRVEGGDKEKIFSELKEFIGSSLEVKVLDLDQRANKLILSEKAKASKALQEKLSQYEVGQTIEGTVSGIVDFGAFITFDGVEGLAHISELGWQLVEDPHDVVTMGETVSAKIIGIEDDKVSLSLKALKANPWDEIDRAYSTGDTVEGTVVKFNPFGAFVRVGPEIQGLAHISEFESYDQMTQLLELGKTYAFRITMLEPKEYKMALRLLSREKSASRVHETSNSDPSHQGAAEADEPAAETTPPVTDGE
jgi:small subunit ribosomal protein S1